MQIKYVVGIAVFMAILTTLLFVPRLAKSQNDVIAVTVPEKATLSVPQIIWLARLMQCESGIKATAINPNDLDNTPSYGILQFKPGTFTHYANKYGIKGTLMDATAQVEIAQQWILTGFDLSNQFPDCVRKLGFPPSTGMTS